MASTGREDGAASPASQGFLEEVRMASPKAAFLTSLLKDSYLDPNYLSSTLSIVSIQRIHNAELQRQYLEKKNELTSQRSKSELQELYGFTVARKSNIFLKRVVANGLKVQETSYNAFGDSSKGIYISKHCDVMLKFAENHHDQCKYLRILVHKLVPGKLLSTNHGTDKLAPTENFDGHIALERPAVHNNVLVQVMLSQIYIYELDKEKNPLPHPRQCLPYAVFTFERRMDSPIPSAMSTDHVVAQQKQEQQTTLKQQQQKTTEKQQEHMQQQQPDLRKNKKQLLKQPLKLVTVREEHPKGQVALASTSSFIPIVPVSQSARSQFSTSLSSATTSTGGTPAQPIITISPMQATIANSILAQTTQQSHLTPNPASTHPQSTQILRIITAAEMEQLVKNGQLMTVPNATDIVRPLGVVNKPSQAFQVRPAGSPTRGRGRGRGTDKGIGRGKGAIQSIRPAASSILRPNVSFPFLQMSGMGGIQLHQQPVPLRSIAPATQNLTSVVTVSSTSQSNIGNQPQNRVTYVQSAVLSVPSVSSGQPLSDPDFTVTPIEITPIEGYGEPIVRIKQEKRRGPATSNCVINIVDDNDHDVRDPTPDPQTTVTQVAPHASENPNPSLEQQIAEFALVEELVAWSHQTKTPLVTDKTANQHQDNREKQQINREEQEVNMEEVPVTDLNDTGDSEATVANEKGDHAKALRPRDGNPSPVAAAAESVSVPAEGSMRSSDDLQANSTEENLHTEPKKVLHHYVRTTEDGSIEVVGEMVLESELAKRQAEMAVSANHSWELDSLDEDDGDDMEAMTSGTSHKAVPKPLRVHSECLEHGKDQTENSSHIHVNPLSHPEYIVDMSTQSVTEPNSLAQEKPSEPEPSTPSTNKKTKTRDRLRTDKNTPDEKTPEPEPTTTHGKSPIQSTEAEHQELNLVISSVASIPDMQCIGVDTMPVKPEKDGKTTTDLNTTIEEDGVQISGSFIPSQALLTDLGPNFKPPALPYLLNQSHENAISSDSQACSNVSKITNKSSSISTSQLCGTPFATEAEENTAKNKRKNSTTIGTKKKKKARLQKQKAEKSANKMVHGKVRTVSTDELRQRSYSDDVQFPHSLKLDHPVFEPADPKEDNSVRPTTICRIAWEAAEKDPAYQPVVKLVVMKNQAASQTLYAVSPPPSPIHLSDEEYTFTKSRVHKLKVKSIPTWSPSKRKLLTARKSLTKGSILPLRQDVKLSHPSFAPSLTSLSFTTTTLPGSMDTLCNAGKSSSTPTTPEKANDKDIAAGPGSTKKVCKTTAEDQEVISIAPNTSTTSQLAEKTDVVDPAVDSDMTEETEDSPEVENSIKSTPSEKRSNIGKKKVQKVKVKKSTKSPKAKRKFSKDDANSSSGNECSMTRRKRKGKEDKIIPVRRGRSLAAFIQENPIAVPTEELGYHLDMSLSLAEGKKIPDGKRKKTDNKVSLAKESEIPDKVAPESFFDPQIPLMRDDPTYVERTMYKPEIPGILDIPSDQLLEKEPPEVQPVQEKKQKPVVLTDPKDLATNDERFIALLNERLRLAKTEEEAESLKATIAVFCPNKGKLVTKPSSSDNEASNVERKSTIPIKFDDFDYAEDEALDEKKELTPTEPVAEEPPVVEADNPVTLDSSFQNGPVDEGLVDLQDQRWKLIHELELVEDICSEEEDNVSVNTDASLEKGRHHAKRKRGRKHRKRHTSTGGTPVEMAQIDEKAEKATTNKEGEIHRSSSNKFAMKFIAPSQTDREPDIGANEKKGKPAEEESLKVNKPGKRGPEQITKHRVRKMSSSGRDGSTSVEKGKAKGPKKMLYTDSEVIQNMLTPKAHPKKEMRNLFDGYAEEASALINTSSNVDQWIHKIDQISQIPNKPGVGNVMEQILASTKPPIKKDAEHSPLKSDDNPKDAVSKDVVDISTNVKTKESEANHEAPSCPGKSSVQEVNTAPSYLRKSSVQEANTDPSCLGKSSIQEANTAPSCPDKTSIQEANTAPSCPGKSSVQEANAAPSCPGKLSVLEANTAPSCPGKSSVQEANTAPSCPDKTSVQEANTDPSCPGKSSMQEANTAPSFPGKSSIQEANTAPSCPGKSSVQEANTAPSFPEKSSVQEANTAPSCPGKSSVQEANTENEIPNVGKEKDTERSKNNTSVSMSTNQTEEKVPEERPKKGKVDINTYFARIAEKKRRLSMLKDESGQLKGDTVNTIQKIVQATIPDLNTNDIRKILETVHNNDRALHLQTGLRNAGPMTSERDPGLNPPYPIEPMQRNVARRAPGGKIAAEEAAFRVRYLQENIENICMKRKELISDMNLIKRKLTSKLEPDIQSKYEQEARNLEPFIAGLYIDEDIIKRELDKVRGKVKGQPNQPVPTCLLLPEEATSLETCTKIPLILMDRLLNGDYEALLGLKVDYLALNTEWRSTSVLDSSKSRTLQNHYAFVKEQRYKILTMLCKHKDLWVMAKKYYCELNYYRKWRLPFYRDYKNNPNPCNKDRMQYIDTRIEELDKHINLICKVLSMPRETLRSPRAHEAKPSHPDSRSSADQVPCSKVLFPSTEQNQNTPGSENVEQAGKHPPWTNLVGKCNNEKPPQDCDVKSTADAPPWTKEPHRTTSANEADRPHSFPKGPPPWLQNKGQGQREDRITPGSQIAVRGQQARKCVNLLMGDKDYRSLKVKPNAQKIRNALASSCHKVHYDHVLEKGLQINKTESLEQKDSHPPSEIVDNVAENVNEKAKLCRSASIDGSFRIKSSISNAPRSTSLDIPAINIAVPRSSAPQFSQGMDIDGGDDREFSDLVIDIPITPDDIKEKSEVDDIPPEVATQGGSKLASPVSDVSHTYIATASRKMLDQVIDSVPSSKLPEHVGTDTLETKKQPDMSEKKTEVCEVSLSGGNASVVPRTDVKSLEMSEPSTGMKATEISQTPADTPSCLVQDSSVNICEKLPPTSLKGPRRASTDVPAKKQQSTEAVTVNSKDFQDQEAPSPALKKHSKDARRNSMEITEPRPQQLMKAATQISFQRQEVISPTPKMSSESKTMTSADITDPRQQLCNTAGKDTTLSNIVGKDTKLSKTAGKDTKLSNTAGKDTKLSKTRCKETTVCATKKPTAKDQQLTTTSAENKSSDTQKGSSSSKQQKSVMGLKIEVKSATVLHKATKQQQSSKGEISTGSKGSLLLPRVLNVKETSSSSSNSLPKAEQSTKARSVESPKSTLSLTTNSTLKREQSSKVRATQPDHRRTALGSPKAKNPMSKQLSFADALSTCTSEPPTKKPKGRCLEDKKTANKPIQKEQTCANEPGKSQFKKAKSPRTTGSGTKSVDYQDSQNVQVKPSHSSKKQQQPEGTKDYLDIKDAVAEKGQLELLNKKTDMPKTQADKPKPEVDFDDDVIVVKTIGETRKELLQGLQEVLKRKDDFSKILANNNKSSESLTTPIDADLVQSRCAQPKSVAKQEASVTAEKERSHRRSLDISTTKRERVPHKIHQKRVSVDESTVVNRSVNATPDSTSGSVVANTLSCTTKPVNTEDAQVKTASKETWSKEPICVQPAIAETLEKQNPVRTAEIKEKGSAMDSIEINSVRDVVPQRIHKKRRSSSFSSAGKKVSNEIPDSTSGNETSSSPSVSNERLNTGDSQKVDRGPETNESADAAMSSEVDAFIASMKLSLANDALEACNRPLEGSQISPSQFNTPDSNDVLERAVPGTGYDINEETSFDRMRKAYLAHRTSSEEYPERIEDGASIYPKEQTQPWRKVVHSGDNKRHSKLSHHDPSNVSYSTTHDSSANKAEDLVQSENPWQHFIKRKSRRNSNEPQDYDESGNPWQSFMKRYKPQQPWNQLSLGRCKQRSTESSLWGAGEQVGPVASCSSQYSHQSQTRGSRSISPCSRSRSPCSRSRSPCSRSRSPHNYHDRKSDRQTQDRDARNNAGRSIPDRDDRKRIGQSSPDQDRRIVGRNQDKDHRRRDVRGPPDEDQDRRKRDRRGSYDDDQEHKRRDGRGGHQEDQEHKIDRRGCHQDDENHKRRDGRGGHEDDQDQRRRDGGGGHQDNQDHRRRGGRGPHEEDLDYRRRGDQDFRKRDSRSPQDRDYRLRDERRASRGRGVSYRESRGEHYSKKSEGRDYNKPYI